MAKAIKDRLVDEVKRPKYLFILDSTPDLIHVYQLSFVLRYYMNVKVYERFHLFVPIESHTGLYILIP